MAHGKAFCITTHPPLRGHSCPTCENALGSYVDWTLGTVTTTHN